MQHLQYGINALSKFIIPRRLPLLRGTLRHIISPVPSLRTISPSFPLVTCPSLRYGPPADNVRVINDFYRTMLCIRGTNHGPVSVCPCLCLSVTSRSSTKTAKRRIT